MKTMSPNQIAGAALAAALVTAAGCANRNTSQVVPELNPVPNASHGPSKLRVGPTTGQDRLRYRLTILGTFGGPLGVFNANVNGGGAAVAVADTTTADPFYPNANPGINDFGADPFVYHAFVWQNGTMTDLGGLPGANSSWASWISSNAIVSGQSINGLIDPLTGWPEENAVIWRNGQITNLGTLGGYESGAGVVNSQGHAVGFSGDSIGDPNSMFGLGTETRAFIYENGKMQDLGTLGGPDAFAFGINGHDQVVGLSYRNEIPSGCGIFPLTTDGFVWQNGTMTDLGGFGGTCTLPSAINEGGRVVGEASLPGDFTSHAFIWYPGRGIRDIGTLGGTCSSANTLNEKDAVVGIACVRNDAALHGFVWNGAGPMIDTGTVGGCDFSITFDINNKGQAVGMGFFCPDGHPHAFEWQNGSIVDLNAFVPNGVQASLIGDPDVINNSGEIWGNARLPNGDERVFVLEPCGVSAGQGDGCIEAAGTRVMHRAGAAIMNRRRVTVSEMRMLSLRRLPIPISRLHSNRVRPSIL